MAEKNNVEPEDTDVQEVVEKDYDLEKGGDLYSLIKEGDDDAIKKHVAIHINKIINKHKLTKYTFIFLFDNCDSITRFHSDKIYNAASSANKKKDIYLLVNSPGGKIEPAYLISKTCKRLSKSKFVVAVPRIAKSAATLTSLGADEIHMGLMSELGPIDPQIGGYPALGLANALNKIAELSSKFPQSSDMFASYLTKNLNLRDLGYFERVSESAAQYAERLLTGKDLPSNHTPESLADHFVNHYKDHGFVIDLDEAIELLGNNIIKTGTPEYKCANDIYSFFDLLTFFLGWFKKKEFYYVGSVNSGLSFKDKE